jgi:excisionase family DNA binding protein
MWVTLRPVPRIGWEFDSLHRCSMLERPTTHQAAQPQGYLAMPYGFGCGAAVLPAATRVIVDDIANNVLECGMDEFMTVTQAADTLGLAVSTVRTRLERGQMQGLRLHPRLWLIPRAEVERWRPLGKQRPGRKPRSST